VCGASSLNLREEHELGVFGKRALRRIIGLRIDEERKKKGLEKIAQ
jgi:hypothetical protein